VCVLCVQRDTPTRLSKLAAVHTLYSLETIDVVVRAALASAETSALGGDNGNASSCKRERWRIHCSLPVPGTPAHSYRQGARRVRHSRSVGIAEKRPGESEVRTGGWAGARRGRAKRMQRTRRGSEDCTSLSGRSTSSTSTSPSATLRPLSRLPRTPDATAILPSRAFTAARGVGSSDGLKAALNGASCESSFGRNRLRPRCAAGAGLFSAGKRTSLLGAMPMGEKGLRQKGYSMRC
jgi:hypothetical protein